MHQKRQSAVECGEEGREERGLGKFGLTEYKRDKTKRQKSGKNGNKKVYRSKFGEIFLISCGR
jgi:hypothetical protein